MYRRLLFDLQPLTTVAELKKLLQPQAETFQPVDVETCAKPAAALRIKLAIPPDTWLLNFQHRESMYRNVARYVCVKDHAGM